MIRNRKQQGISTIVVAVILLAILTVVTAFALNVGVFEQRTVGNENRARIVSQVADAGLNHAIEVVKANAGNLTLPDASGGWAGRWVRCASTDTSFPCVAEPDPARRAQLYRYFDVNATAGAETSLVGAGSRVTDVSPIQSGGGGKVGSYDVSYRVGALLCPVDSDNPTLCAPFQANYSGLLAITLVSRGSLSDDPNALADVKATIASFKTIGNAPNVPIIASGNVDIGGGTADIVPNPNAGGTGVALSIWSGSNVTNSVSGGGGGTGDVKTCQLGEFLTNVQGANGPVQYDGITRCDSCRCDGLLPDKGLISGKYTAGGVGRLEGYDILDASDDGSELPPATYFPDDATTPVSLDDPADCYDDNLFEYLFGANVVNASGCTQPLVTAEDYLQNTLNAQIITDCGALTSLSSGLLWFHPPDPATVCVLPNGEVGTPSNPVFLVTDGPIQFRANTVVFGVLYSRNISNIDPTLDATGGGVVYGTVVVQGSARVRGSPKFIYNEKVILAIVSSSEFNRFGVVPVSWTDVVPE